MALVHYEALQRTDERATDEEVVLDWWLRYFAKGAPSRPALRALSIACDALANETMLRRTGRRITWVNVYDHAPAETMCRHHRVYGSGGLGPDDMEFAAAVFTWEENATYTIVFTWDDNTQETVLELRLAPVGE